MRFVFLLALLLVSPLNGICREPNQHINDWYVWTQDDARLYVAQVGVKDTHRSPIIVLHGGLGAEYSYLLSSLSPLTNKHQFTFFDQRGSLRSPVARTKITLEGMVEDIETLRKELKSEKIRIVAHSMGAFLAYSYIRKYGINVESVTLIAPVFPFHSGSSPDAPLFKALGLPSSDPTYMGRLEKIYKDFSARAEALSSALIKDLGLDAPELTGAQKTDAWRIRFASMNIYHLDRWRKMEGGMAFYNPNVYSALVENAGGLDAWQSKWDGLFDSLKRFDGKVTFVIGKNDFIDPAFQFWPQIVSSLPRARLVSIDEAGHNIWIDQPQRFQEAVEAAL